MHICLHHLSLLMCPPTSDSVRHFPNTSRSVRAERFGCRFRFGIGFRLSLRLCCRFCLRLGRSLWFAFRRRLCLAFGDRFLGVRLCFPSSSRSSTFFSPAVGYALVLPAVGYALVCLLLAMLLSCLLLTMPCRFF